MIKYSMVIFMLVILGGCVAWEPTVGPQIFYVDPVVERSWPELFVVPVKPATSPLGCVCYPFEVRQKIDNGPRIGQEIGRIFWNQLAAGGPFTRTGFIDVTWPGVSAACNYASKQRMNLVAMGVITQFMQAGSTGTTCMSLEFRIYDVRTQKLIWSMALAGRVEGGPDRDYMVARAKTRMPQSPEYLVVRALASDVRRMLKQWRTNPNWHGVVFPIPQSLTPLQ